MLTRFFHIWTLSPSFFLPQVTHIQTWHRNHLNYHVECIFSIFGLNITFIVSKFGLYSLIFDPLRPIFKVKLEINITAFLPNSKKFSKLKTLPLECYLGFSIIWVVWPSFGQQMTHTQSWARNHQKKYFLTKCVGYLTWNVSSRVLMKFFSIFEQCGLLLDPR
jgi:hypothetical protein